MNEGVAESALGPAAELHFRPFLFIDAAPIAHYKPASGEALRQSRLSPHRIVNWRRGLSRKDASR
jgi:hypothetical protein